jgi:hypothetical protein
MCCKTTRLEGTKAVPRRQERKYDGKEKETKILSLNSYFLMQSTNGLSPW